MMKHCKALMLVIWAAACFLPAGLWAAELPPDFDFQASVETYFEGRLLDSLKDVLGTSDLIAVVHADVGTSTLTPGARSSDDGGGPAALPGVPVQRKVGAEGPRKLDPSFLRYLRKLSAIIYLDTEVPTAQDEVITEVVKGVMGYDVRRGDSIQIKRIALAGEKPAEESVSLFTPPNLYWTILVVAGTIFLLSASFFFVSGKVSASDLSLGMITGGGGGKTETTAPTFETHNVFQTAPTPGQAEAGAEAESKVPPPFQFVESRHIRNLSNLFRNRPDDDVATVASYLPPELMNDFLERFPEDRQIRVALTLSADREIEPEEVRRLEEDVKMRLDYLVGGEDKLLAIMDRANDSVRERIFKSLREMDKAAADRIGKRIKSLETVLGELSSEAISVLVRRVDSVVFAQILRESSEELRQKVFGAMTAGAAERMKQEIEMSRPLSSVRLSKEKKNVVALVRQLASEGLIEEA